MNRKRLTFTALGMLLIGLAWAAIPPLPPLAQVEFVTLFWEHPGDYPEGSTNWEYRIYAASGSAGVWTVLTNVPGTNTSVSFPLQRGEWFFYATTYDPSNFWRESEPFVSTAGTGAPPPKGSDLGIRKGK